MFKNFILAFDNREVVHGSGDPYGIDVSKEEDNNH